MRTRIFVSSCAAAVLSIALSTASAAGQRDGRDVTATGCVQRQAGGVRSELVLTKIGGGAVYVLSGARERDLARYVGQRVEIVGRIAGDTTAPRAVGTSGRLPAATDPVNKRDAQQPTGAVTDPATGRGVPAGDPVKGRRPRANAAADARLDIVSFTPAGRSCE